MATRFLQSCLALSLAGSVLNGQAPKGAHVSPGDRAFHPIERMVSIPVDAALFGVDVGLSRHGNLFHALQRDQILFLDASRKIAVKRPNPLPEGAINNHCVKFRAGAFWVATENRIFRFDPYLERWELRLDPGGTFRQFEVNQDEDIFLIHPQKGASLDASPELNVNRRDKQSLILVKRFKRQATEADKEIEFPSEAQSFYELLGDVHGFTRTAQWGDQAFLYDPDTGLALVLDLSTAELHSCAHTKFQLDWRDPRHTRSKHRQRWSRRHEWDGTRGSRVGFQPQSASDLFIITRITVSTPERRREVEEKFAEQGIATHYFPNRTTLPPGIWMVVYRFDEASRSFKEELKTPYDREKHKQPLWYSATDGLIPLKDHFSRQDELFRKQRKTEEEARRRVASAVE